MPAQSTFSLSFNGTTGFVEGTDAALPNLANPVTVSAWFKSAQAAGATQVIAGYGDISNNSFWWLFLNGSGFIGFTNGSDVVGAVNYANDGTWHHAAGTYDGTTYTVYLDGASKASGTRTTAITRNSNFRVGDAGGSRFFGGKIDDVGVFAACLTAGQVAGLAAGTTDPSTLSPVLLWRLETGSGTTATDTGSGAHDGAFTGGVTWSSDVPSALSGAVQDAPELRVGARRQMQQLLAQ